MRRWGLVAMGTWSSTLEVVRQEEGMGGIHSCRGTEAEEGAWDSGSRGATRNTASGGTA